MSRYHYRRRNTARYGNSTKSQVVDLTKIVREILDEYGGEAQAEVIDAFNEVAPKIEARLQQESREKFGGYGYYAKGWTLEGTQTLTGNPAVIVYNKNEPTLTHLLENGHDGYLRKDGTRTPRVAGRPHIEPVRKWAEEEMYNEVKRRLEQ